VEGSGIDWQNWGQISSGIGDDPGVIMADLDGDGKADFIHVSEEGLVIAYRNGGQGSGGAGAGTWVWQSLGTISDCLGNGRRESIRFADIDGDGRADYLVIGPSGSVTAWLNIGSGQTPEWRYIGEIASGDGDRAGVHLLDMNGDGRADYLYLDQDGKLKAYINYQGHNSGFAPNWIPTAEIASGVGTTRANITFGDLNGDGKADYICRDAKTGSLKVWFNAGSGGRYTAGAGVLFADLDGDGLDDYLAMDENGTIDAYINGGPNGNSWI
jgi:hypothetical protein